MLFYERNAGKLVIINISHDMRINVWILLKGLNWILKYHHQLIFGSCIHLFVSKHAKLCVFFSFHETNSEIVPDSFKFNGCIFFIMINIYYLSCRNSTNYLEIFICGLRHDTKILLFD